MQLSYFLQRSQHFWIRLYAHIHSVQLSVCVSLNLRAHSVDARVEHGGNTSNGIKGARVSREHGNNSNRVRGSLNAITSASDYRCYVFFFNVLVFHSSLSRFCLVFPFLRLLYGVTDFLNS